MAIPGAPQPKEGHLQVKSSFGWVVDKSSSMEGNGGQLSVLGVDRHVWLDWMRVDRK